MATRKNFTALTEADIQNVDFGRANGRIVGELPQRLTQKQHHKIKEKHGWPQFIHTPSYSGAIIALKNGNIALGCCNIGRAGRGYVFNSLAELRKALA